MILDQVMVDRSESRELEWRNFVGDCKSGAVLFADSVGYGNQVRPDLVVRQKAKPNWMSHGVSDYLRTEESLWLLRNIPKTWQQDQYKAAIAVDTHGSCEQVYERERVGRIICARWPSRGPFIAVPLDLTPLRPAPSLKATVWAWAAAKASGRAVSEEDNLAAMGLGGREMQLLGGYENVLNTAPPEKLAKVRPLRPGPDVAVDTELDTAIQSGLAVHTVTLPACGLVLPPVVSRTITVVAAAHGAGLSRLSRRFHQESVARFDRVAKGWCGVRAYDRPWDHVNDYAQHYAGLAEVVARNLASGKRPMLRTLLTHEKPDVICEALRRHGIQSRWILYCPDEVERAKRVAERNISAAVRRYMMDVLCRLYQCTGSDDRVDHEETLVSLMATAVRAGVG